MGCLEYRIGTQHVNVNSVEQLDLACCEDKSIIPMAALTLEASFYDAHVQSSDDSTRVSASFAFSVCVLS